MLFQICKKRKKECCFTNEEKMLSLILALLMLICLAPAAVFAEGEATIDARDRNVIKVTTAADFAAGELAGLEPASIGNGAIALAAGATEGTFTSAVYQVVNFQKMVATWNASIYDGTTVETQARAYTGSTRLRQQQCGR